MKTQYHSFEDLLIWQEGMELCYSIYDSMEQCRDFKLRDQIRACAVSVPSNIAEGFELSTDRAFIRHLYIAKGSLGEFRTQLKIAIRQKYVTQEIGDHLTIRSKKLGGMIHNFILARKKKSHRKPL